MTFILVHNQSRSSAILADSMLTTEHFAGDDADRHVGVKNGILLPGTIFGLTGNFQEGMRFVIRCRERARSCKDPTQNFAVICDTAKNNFIVSPGCNFQLAISSRHSGEPKHYLIDSKLMDVAEAPSTLELGMGIRELGDIAEAALHTMISEESMAALAETNRRFSQDLWPYLLCFFLNQNSFGSRSKDVQKSRTGGIIHFVQQTADAEYRQKLTMFVFAYNPANTEGMGLFRIQYELVDDNLLVYRKNYEDKGEWQLLLTNYSMRTKAVDHKKFKKEFDAAIKTRIEGPPYFFLMAGVTHWEGVQMCPYIDVFDGKHICADLDDYLEPNLDRILNITGSGRAEEITNQLPRDSRSRCAGISPHPDRRLFPRETSVIEQSGQWKLLNSPRRILDPPFEEQG